MEVLSSRSLEYYLFCLVHERLRQEQLLSLWAPSCLTGQVPGEIQMGNTK